MTEQEIEKEFNDFMEKFAKSSREFLNDFEKLSSVNKQRFQSLTSSIMPNGIMNLQCFLNTKF